MKTLLLGLLLSAVVLAVHSEDKVKPGKKSDYLAKVFSKKTAKRGDVCENTCSWPNDGDCDDGGPGSQYSLCDLGTDCGDCGARYIPGICEDTCTWAYDGECDDGGPGSLYSICEYGSDCADCGERDEEPEEVNDGCTDTCVFPNDGDCDDGGPGSQYSICDLGTDCGDCGPRGECTDDCSYAHDGECDDGGEGSLYSICTHGTDCADCGVRLGRSLEMKKGKVAKTSSSQGKSIKDMVAEKAKVVKQPPSKPGNVGK